MSSEKNNISYFKMLNAVRISVFTYSHTIRHLLFLHHKKKKIKAQIQKPRSRVPGYEPSPRWAGQLLHAASIIQCSEKVVTSAIVSGQRCRLRVDSRAHD